jgi:hypothetical protein
MEMAFRTEKRIGAFITGLLLSPALFAQQSLQYQAWHGHSRPPHIRKAGGFGTLTIDDTGVSFQETYKGKPPKRPHAWHWDYRDIQQLKIDPKSLTVLTYQDNKWKLGADREYEFDLVSDKTLRDAYDVLRMRLDQRFVAALPDRPADVLWEIRVKQLRWPAGHEGTLQVGRDKIVYNSSKESESRTWRLEDIDNISSSGPFQLTIVSFEKAKADYGSLKEFNFQLKQRLEDSQYNDLWLRLNQSKGLKVLSFYNNAKAFE